MADAAAGMLLGACAALMAHALVPAALLSLPHQATHDLTEGCAWQARPWAEALGVNDQPVMRPAAQLAQYRCRQAHGLRSRLPIIKTLLPDWPSAAVLAALSRQEPTEDDLAHQAAFFAPPPPAAGELSVDGSE